MPQLSEEVEWFFLTCINIKNYMIGYNIFFLNCMVCNKIYGLFTAIFDFMQATFTDVVWNHYCILWKN
jgi:hypothetical protein